MKHDKTHETINYDNKYYICGLHNEVYSLYCKTCKKNICTLCEQDHEDHDIIRLGKLIIKKNDLENKLKEFKISLDKFREDIKKIINIFQKVLDYCESFYKINKEIINNFDMKNRNYYILNNLKEFYNDDISKKLKDINGLDNYGQKITQICKMYNIIDNNKLNFEFISGETEKIINEKGDKLMTVIFNSDDQKVHYSLICKSTDKFKDVEQRLYKIYPEFSKTNNYFLANGNTINKSKSLEDNKIKNSNLITLYVYDE
jgi:ATP-dependent Lon protease